MIREMNGNFTANYIIVLIIATTDHEQWLRKFFRIFRNYWEIMNGCKAVWKFAKTAPSQPNATRNSSHFCHIPCALTKSRVCAEGNTHHCPDCGFEMAMILKRDLVNNAQNAACGQRFPQNVLFVLHCVFFVWLFSEPKNMPTTTLIYVSAPRRRREHVFLLPLNELQIAH